MNITHISASPVGIRVWAESEVTLVDGKQHRAEGGRL